MCHFLTFSIILLGIASSKSHAIEETQTPLPSEDSISIIDNVTENTWSNWEVDTFCTVDNLDCIIIKSRTRSTKKREFPKGTIKQTLLISTDKEFNVLYKIMKLKNLTNQEIIKERITPHRAIKKYFLNYKPIEMEVVD